MLKPIERQPLLWVTSSFGFNSYESFSFVLLGFGCFFFFFANIQKTEVKKQSAKVEVFHRMGRKYQYDKGQYWGNLKYKTYLSSVSTGVGGKQMENSTRQTF